VIRLAVRSRGPRAAESLTAHDRDSDDCGLRAAGVLGAIVLALLTNLPVSFFVTSLSFVCYLLGRFAVGPCLLGWERSARAALRCL
jgi:hypothetical protein